MALPHSALLYSRSDAGHRLAFVEFFSSLMPAKRASGARELFLARQPVLFLMIEEAFGLYVLLCLVRGVLGRRTVGLLFRPGPALSGASIRLRIKRLVLQALKRLPLSTTLTIIPFSVEPRFAAIADGWIDDPQQWDLSDDDLASVERLRASPSGLAKTMRESAGTRRVVAALGRQDRDKGFDQMARTYMDSEPTRNAWLFAAGGKIAPASADAAKDFVACGGQLIDRQVSNDEMLELYAGADLVWGCYSKDYDQSSGILGRAAQLGIPTIVRQGSLLQRICEGADIAHLAFDPDRPEPLAYQPPQPSLGLKARDRMRTRSMDALHRALHGVAVGA